MALALSAEDAAFRDEVRATIAAQFSPQRPWTGSADDEARWAAVLNARGWAAYKWPVEHGGTGWSPTHKYLWERECALAGVPPLLSFMGNVMLAPVLIGWGTPEQQARHLPGIRENRVQWCQGYSEPGAGSDLAALSTRAERDGDSYVVTGEKIWTSHAHTADWMFALVRTAIEARQQDGISFLLIDMRSPGIAVHPIDTIEGRHHLNRVTFDAVRVPSENRVGDEGAGWSVAKGLLTHERTGLAHVADCIRLMALLRREMPAGDPLFSAAVAEAEIDLIALETTELRTLAETEAGQAPGPYASLLKLTGSQLIQRMTALLVECAGPDAMRRDGGGRPWVTEEVRRYLTGRAATIAGGATEVQKDIIARHVLGL